jgi:hypothetical protein
MSYITRMKEERIIFNSLNEQQLMMVRLLKKPLHEDDFVQIRKLATKLVTARLDAAMGAWEMKQKMEERETGTSGQ